MLAGFVCLVTTIYLIGMGLLFPTHSRITQWVALGSSIAAFVILYVEVTQ
jgi:hypothetical protein